MTRHPFGLLLLVTLVAPPAGGCTQVIRPPQRPAHPAKVYVADYGLHSIIFLPVPSKSGDYADDGAYVEYAFGDWSWMAMNHNGTLDALAAVFLSPRSALGRRAAGIKGGQFEPDMKAVPERMTGFYAEAADVRRLSDALARRFAADLERKSVWNEEDQTTYAQDPEHYWLFHHCNHVTRRWLREVGCDVRGLLVTSRFKLARTKVNAKTPRTPRGGREDIQPQIWHR
jgi:hypothetical protein